MGRISMASYGNMRTQSLSVLMTGLVYCSSWIPYSIVLFKFFMHAQVSVDFELVGIFLSKSATISSPVISCLVERAFCPYVKEGLVNQLRLDNFIPVFDLQVDV